MATDHRLRLQDLPYKVGAGDIAIHVRRQIIGGELLHGERLPPERAFADQFGVSRGTVRDALRRLEEGGFVQKRPGSGTYVMYSDTETVSIAQSTSPLELIDTRYALEPQIVRFAVLNATGPAVALWRDRPSAANRPPAPVGTISPLRVGLNEGSATVNVSGAFRDPDGDPLTYGVTSSATQVAAVSVSGSQVTVSPVSAGTATIRVTATDPGGLSAAQTFEATVEATGSGQTS